MCVGELLKLTLETNYFFNGHLDFQMHANVCKGKKEKKNVETVIRAFIPFGKM